MSAIGEPLVSTSLLVSCPTSPFGSTRTVYPVLAVKAASTFFGIAQESCVATTTVFVRVADVPSELVALPPTAQPPRRPTVRVAAASVRHGWAMDTFVSRSSWEGTVKAVETRLPSPVLAGSGSRVCGVPHSQRPGGAPLSFRSRLHLAGQPRWPRTEA